MKMELLRKNNTKATSSNLTKAELQARAKAKSAKYSNVFVEKLREQTNKENGQ